MAEVQAFRGFRYDLARVGELSNVIAPPYDVIDAALQDQLYGKSPYNVIRLELNKESAADSEADNRYTRSAGILRDWQRDGVLVQDSARSLYVYHQDFTVEGKTYTRKGVMARVRLEPFGSGRIYPHEETLSGPKADRLKLFKATGMNLSQIFGLYPDESGEVMAKLESAVGRSLPLQATDHLGVVSKVWPITDQAVHSAVASLLGPKPIFIADGHHRYETGLKYLEEKRQSGEVKTDDHPANFILMQLVSMQDPGLVILPTHRLVRGVGELKAADIQKKLGDLFSFERVAGGARETWDMIEADGTQNAFGFGTLDGVWQFARFKNQARMDELSADHSPAWRELAVAVLQRVVLDKAMPGQVTYVHLIKEVNDAMAAKECQVAVLVPPASMGHVEEIAGNLEKMPPKSTYFYPKLLSGLVFHSLKSQ